MAESAVVMPTLEEVRAFFFRGMLNGYVSGSRTITRIPEMPGYKLAPFRHGDFYLLDMWSKTEDSDRSSGMTNIWYRDKLVWEMQYGGHYPEEAIPFLKEVLRQAYESGNFYGGRGPRRHEDKSGIFLYTNEPWKFWRFGDFARFKGHEEIHRRGPDGYELIGHHDYTGMSILPLQADRGASQ